MKSQSLPLAVRCVDLVKAYGTTAAPVHVLRGVSLDVGRGERVAILGKSGSGKSTLLNLLGGIDQPTRGSLQVAGRDLDRLSGRELARFRSAAVGMIFQSFNLIPSRTALENVELPMIFAGRPPRERRAEARRALEAVGLGARLHHRPAQLSGGEAQRVAVARALVNQPAILLADEPTGNLDTANSNAVLEILRDLNTRTRQTILMITHNPEAAAFADRTVTMRDGSIVAS